MRGGAETRRKYQTRGVALAGCYCPPIKKGGKSQVIYAYPRTSCVLEGDHFGISVTTPFALKYVWRQMIKIKRLKTQRGGGSGKKNMGTMTEIVAGISLR